MLLHFHFWDKYSKIHIFDISVRTYSITLWTNYNKYNVNLFNIFNKLKGEAKK